MPETTDQLAGLAKLRAEVPEHLVGKLPRVTCRECTQNRGQCPQHRKTKCRDCGAYISPSHIHLDYVGHAETTSLLLDADPMWSWEPLALDADGLPKFDENRGLWIRLTVCGVTRLGYGTADNTTGSKARGDLIKEVIGDAIRNGAMRFGVALDLWAKTDLHHEDDKAPGPAQPQHQVADAVARKAQREADEQPPVSGKSKATRPQLTKITLLLRDKFGITDRNGRLAKITPYIARNITSGNDLTFNEATHIINQLNKLPDAATLTEQDTDRRAPLTTAADGSDQMFEDMTIAIADATTTGELEGLYLSAKHAHELGKLTDEQFAKLNELGAAQNEDLRVRAGASA